MEGLGVNLPPGGDAVQGYDNDRFEITVSNANGAFSKMSCNVAGCLSAWQKRSFLAMDLDEHV